MTREKRLLRALRHAFQRQHSPNAACWACLEGMAFVTEPGYSGDLTFPVTPHFDGASRRQGTHRFMETR